MYLHAVLVEQNLIKFKILASINTNQFKHRNPPALSIEDCPVHSERTLLHNHRIHEDVQMNTVFSEIKKH
jgi:hypothetical protein